ncbi:MAG TPA: GNAT family N-acetyltransferase [Candidatus Fermentibacter daniensis]|nr:GNAT family N-acetyltransferase [Candidatus Fermentibacter daniensis]HOR06439.1 GNAT family N-acetyltransferase [Candidatus Fermentibacter daniensis]HPK52428.1 GNAT family N-acetyltransferase [Candidatus Fermentibacter daniensis]
MSALCSMLPWDSEFFSMRIARYNRSGMDSIQRRRVRDWCAGNRIDCLYFLADPSDRRTVMNTETLGMRFVGARADLVLECPAMTAGARRSVEHSSPEDREVLLDMASTGHTNTRFWLDIGFPRRKVAGLYRLWMCRALEDRDTLVLVRRLPGVGVVGYGSFEIRDGTGRIDLLGVREGYRGHGIGREIVGAGVEWLGSSGADFVTVATQGDGGGSIRLYESAGFRMNRISAWFHYWPSRGRRP